MKRARLFYYNEGVDSFVPITDDDLESILDNLSEDEEVEVRFKRVDLTDEELDELPEAG